MNQFKAAAILFGSAAMLLVNIRLAPLRRAWHGDVARVERENLVLAVRCAGTISAKNTRTVRAEVGAHVLKKYVNEGDPVKPGQLLLELDSVDILKTMRGQEDDLRNLSREYVKAKKEVKIQKNLFKYGAVSRKNIEDAQSALEKAAGAARNAAKTLADTRKLLGKTKIFAPMGGLLIKDYLKDEETVQPDKALFLVGRLDVFRADLGVDEVDLARVAAGQKVELRVEAFPAAALAGRVASVALAAERTNFAKVGVTVDILDSKRLPLKPNLSVAARIITGYLPGVLTIPVRAVTRRQGENWVETISPIGRTPQRRVQLGDSNDERVVVLSGLKEGEVVLISN